MALELDKEPVGPPFRFGRPGINACQTNAPFFKRTQQIKQSTGSISTGDQDRGFIRAAGGYSFPSNDIKARGVVRNVLDRLA